MPASCTHIEGQPINFGLHPCLSPRFLGQLRGYHHLGGHIAIIMMQLPFVTILRSLYLCIFLFSLSHASSFLSNGQPLGQPVSTPPYRRPSQWRNPILNSVFCKCRPPPSSRGPKVASPLTLPILSQHSACLLLLFWPRVTPHTPSMPGRSSSRQIPISQPTRVSRWKTAVSCMYKSSHLTSYDPPSSFSLCSITFAPVSQLLSG